MTGIIKVTPQKLNTTAEEFKNQSTNISTLTNEMMNKITALSSSWEGDASQAYITKFKSLEKDIQMLQRMIQEHVSDLQQMAAEYAAAEQSNTQEANALLSGIIS